MRERSRHAAPLVAPRRCRLAGRTLANRLALPPPHSWQLVRVEGVAGALKGFSDATKAQQFERRAQRSASIWCCSRPPGESMRGHVWYDFYADQVPHTDRFGRAFHKPWDPRFGP